MSVASLRQSNDNTSTQAPVVDLGYGIYEGYYNATSQLNIFKGIRYAAPPTGTLRWQKPQAPATNRSQTISAKAYPPRCPQSNDAPMPANYNFTSSGLGNEDCLFLSVFTPQHATNLPVLIWIHGGGYGTGQGNNDLSELIMTNSHGFIVVIIQYRLGAFGFLSSAEVSHFGTPNAGLFDMHFSFQWVKKYIHLFGGNASHVTISGESAGAGAVMLQAMAYGGKQGTELFSNAIVASPYLPTQWGYDDFVPTQSYYLFAQAAGCFDQMLNTVNSTIFECLQRKDTVTLQNASAYISADGKYGQWAFLPVTDGEFIQKRPSEQLLAGEVNGLRMLSGNNADEGPGFVRQTITTEADFNTYTQSLFPLMKDTLLTQVQTTYAIAPTTPGPLFSTLGSSGPTALNQSEFGIGQQQRLDNLYAETTFVCPSYWLASAYSRAWKYQYSVPPSEHGADLDAYYAINREALGYGTLSPGFRTAVQMIWGRFIMFDDPTLPMDVVKSITMTENGTTTGDDIVAAGTGSWPVWGRGGEAGYRMLNLNMTGGHETKILWSSADGVKFNVTQYAGPGLTANFDVVDAWSWEGGRGARCEFWADIGKWVPE
ncbi:carboxylesterase family protein-like protein [Mollisia scopiformis]|uniref:Carboxylic ester hydrolase n=1 Tax=Mollisia scopiformis TaxID=149040 RepID=A0A194WYZ1_MOLSC|nr:carboxylesterase family protein-like protein [Mollisia scopiformis]KUJ13183.1 carboxylesterase family protein-like protein [Mollisia scopiformis]